METGRVSQLVKQTIALAGSLAALAGCEEGCDPQRGVVAPIAAPSCSARVTAGDGTFGAAAHAETGESEKAVRKRALEKACEARCSEREPEAVKACRAHCLVDIQAGKAGARVSCEGFSSGE